MDRRFSGVLLLAGLSSQLGVALAASAGESVQLDIGCPGSRVQAGWIGWHIGSGQHWDGQGPFSIRIAHAAFDPDGFTVALGPKGAIGYRSGPTCTGPHGPVIEEIAFSRAANPFAITLSGLRAGAYRIVTWHNDSRGYVQPPLDIVVTDARGQAKPVLKGCAETGATDSADAAQAEFLVVADGASDVTIRYRIPGPPKTHAPLNAIEILGGPAVHQAFRPQPIHGAERVPPDTRLSWRPGLDAVGHEVWLGTAPRALTLAAAAGTAASCDPGRLRHGQTYYWRVDELRPTGKQTGQVWRFTTDEGKATSPLPRTGATKVSTHPVLAWTPGHPDARHAVHLGTKPNALPCVADKQAATTCPARDLELGRTYYWRVDEVYATQTVTGDVWSFTIERGAAKWPRPADREGYVAANAVLRWQAAGPAAKHSVYLGTERHALARVAAEQAEAAYDPRGLDFARTYYWRVDEVRPNSTVKGRTWSFTVGDWLAVDDMEAYGDAGATALCERWRDGRGDRANGSVLKLSAGPDRAIQITYASVGAQGGPQRAEVRRDFGAPQDWTVGGAGTLQLKCRWGARSAAARLYVALEDSAGHVARVVQRADGSRAKRAAWQLWRIALSEWRGVDLSKIAGVGVGVEPGAARLAEGVSGTVCIDDIRLYPRAAGRAKAAPRPSRTAGITGIPGAWTRGYEKGVPPSRWSGAELSDLRADVCVVGGGSGGIGAAIAAARAGASVIVVEREERLGGTSTQAYVNSWEPGPGCSIAREIHERLTRIPKAVSTVPYERTLTRARMRSLQFEVEPFCKAVDDMIAATGKCRVLLNTSFVEAETHVDGQRVWAIKAVSKSGATYRIRARVFIDCTGGAYLCQAAGCEVMLGEDPRSRFGEPSAPEQPRKRLNALILGYRIRRSGHPAIEPPPDPPLVCRGGYAFKVPSGDMLVNPCGGMMQGWELIHRGYDGAMAECRRRVRAHWHWLQKTRYRNYELVSHAPMLGIRESYRVVGEYVLREQDLRAGVRRQPHPDIIAIADHPLDTHGPGGVRGKVAAPYGIPYRCLIPKGGWTDLLVACRGASFSHIAASSCRLSRTIMALGHAAGVAAAMAAKADVPVGEIDVAALRKALDVPAPPGVAASPAAAARPGGAGRKRRILYNIDGCSCMAVKKGSYKPGPITRADLHAIADELTEPGSQVDTLLVCINCQVMYYPTKVGTMVGSLVSPEGRKKRRAWITNLEAFYSKGVDPYAVVLARAKERGLEALLTFRMNDAHAGDRNSGIRSALWLDNPQYRLGYGLDFDHKEVRDDAFRRIREAVQRYDCDGIELDWHRFPTYFKKGEANKHIPTLNQFVRDVRRVTNEVGKRRGRPMLLAVRVMRNLERARAVGLDPVTWAKEGLIDFLTVSRFLHNPEGVLAIGQYRQAIPNIPIYGSVEFGTASGKPATVDEYRCEARKLWADGVDGIYLFNFFCSRAYGKKSWEPPFFLLKEFGDPKKIKP